MQSVTSLTITLILTCCGYLATLLSLCITYKGYLRNKQCFPSISSHARDQPCAWWEWDKMLNHSHPVPRWHAVPLCLSFLFYLPFSLMKIIFHRRHSPQASDLNKMREEDVRQTSVSSPLLTVAAVETPWPAARSEWVLAAEDDMTSRRQGDQAPRGTCLV